MTASLFRTEVLGTRRVVVAKDWRRFTTLSQIALVVRTGVTVIAVSVRVRAVSGHLITDVVCA